MKPASTKSRILGRLTALLLVPVMLSSNAATVYVSADDEIAVETQVSESNQEETQTENQGTENTEQSEEPATEVENGSETEETVSEEAEVVEGSGEETEETETTEATEETEAEEELEGEIGEEELEGEPAEQNAEVLGSRRGRNHETPTVNVSVIGANSGVLNGAGTVDAIYDPESGSYYIEMEPFTIKSQYTDLFGIDSFGTYGGEIRDGRYYLPEDSLTGGVWFKIIKKYTQLIDLGTMTTPGVATYTDGAHEVFCSDNAEDLFVGIDVDPVAVSFVRQIFVVYDGGSAEMDGSNGSFTWTPTGRGNYSITGFRVVNAFGEENYSLGNDDKFTLCYYDIDADQGAINSTNDNTDWTNNPTPIKVKGNTVLAVEEISLIDETGNILRTESVNSNNINKELAFPTGDPNFDLNGTKTYTVSVKFKNGSEYTLPQTHTLKYDSVKPSEDAIRANVRKDNMGIRAKLTGEVVFHLDKEGDVNVSPTYNVNAYVTKTTWMLKVTWPFRLELVPHETTEEVKVIENGKANSALPGFHMVQNDNDCAVSFTIKTGREGLATSYRISCVTVTDKAGNSSGKYFEGCGQDNDIYPPEISYYLGSGNNHVNIKDLPADGENRYFTKSEVDETVIIQDYSLKTEEGSVKFEDCEGADPDKAVNDLMKHAETQKFEDNGRVIGYSYKIHLSDGVYYFKTTAEDAEGQPATETMAHKVIVDTKSPVVTVHYGDKVNTPDDYYGSSPRIVVEVDERWLNTEESYVKIEGVSYDGNQLNTYTETLSKGSWSEENGKFYITWPTLPDGKYRLSYYAVDLAQNDPAASPDSKEFTIDSHAPTFVSIEYKNPNVRNGKYYNETQTVVITYRDLTFDKDKSKITVDHKFDGRFSTGDGWVQSGDDEFTWTATVVCEGDDIYNLSFAPVDLLGNVSEVRTEKEFVVDKTAPDIKVAYDSSEPRNGIYFKNERTATLDIEDISFDADSVKVTTQPNADITELPQLGGFSSEGKSNYSHMTFSVDGTYGYIINCMDLAGNTATAYTSDVFVIDTTAPEVSFAGVENFSANNGVVAPSVTYIDKYMDMDATTVTMIGSNNGPVTVGGQAAPTENGFVVSYSDFEHVKSMDDLYTLQATVYDLAGNETKEQLVFSVNRFGSVFVLGDSAKILNEQYYTTEPTDVSITEINVDELTYKNVSISRDGDVKELKNGRQYKVTKQGNDTTWKTYTYTISKDNFKKDGIYSVTVYTKDRATNVQDNKSRDAEINFAVDRTAPSIVAAGLKSGETYKESSHTVNIDVTDNMGVTSLAIYKDGQEIETYDADALETAGGVESITLTESEKKQTITIVAEDVAGNVETVVYDNILVSTKEPTKDIVDLPTPEIDTPPSDKPDDNDANPAMVIIFIVLALAVVASGAGAGVAIYKKKNDNQ